MVFKSISIKNFRNFEDASIDLENKNVFFGMNDIGKTNFLYAMRYLFDRDTRKNDLLDADYFKRRINTPIEITVAIDISDAQDIDTEKLRAKLKGNIGSKDTSVYIKLIAEYDEQESRGNIVLRWGSNEKNLVEMKSTSGGFAELDSVFQVYYINSYIDLNNLFKKNISALVKKNAANIDDDREKELLIEEKAKEINDIISKISGVVGFQDKLTPAYKKMRDEEIIISIKSDFAINSLYSNIVPYISKEGDEGEYPTQGEGRKKLVAYAVHNIIAENTDEKKINLFLIEEPETHLHRSMQSALSNFLFDSKVNNNMLKYLFISTHSSAILSDMDEVNLVRLYDRDKIKSDSKFYKVPDEWNKIKKRYNRFLSEAIFYDKVILVEGMSEQVLFECVLFQIDRYYESKGISIISIEGIGFTPYIQILSSLGIELIIKTDNDITKVNSKSEEACYQALGFSRVNKIMKEIKEIEYSIDYNLPRKKKLSKDKSTVEGRQKLYDDNKEKLDNIRSNYKIHLSHSGFEEDLYECMGERLIELTGNKDPVKFLQTKKKNNMVELVNKLEPDDCQIIYNHYNFACLKAVLD